MCGILDVNLREDKLLNPKSDLQRRQNTFAAATKSNEAAFRCSFSMSQISAKKLKPFMDGDYVSGCIMKATEIIFPEEQQLSEAIRTSANTVPDGVNDLVKYM
jgi:hypothetical protein